MRTELADVNVLLAVANSDHTDHIEASAWLRAVSRFATTPITEAGLVRLLMNARVMETPATMSEAVAALSAIRSLRHADFLADATSLADARAITTHVTGTKQVTDTHLLNLAIAHGCVLTTFDARLRASLPSPHRHHVRVIGDAKTRRHSKVIRTNASAVPSSATARA